MALDAFVKFEFEKQGWINGGCVRKGREKLCEVIEMSHAVESPRDPASGQATGKRRHKPMRLRYYYDKSVPLMYQALTRNEAGKLITIDCYSPNKVGVIGGQGVETLTYQIKLTNAFISSIEHHMPNNKNAELMKYEHTISVELVYQKIEWTWLVDGTKSAFDDWTAGITA